MVDLILTYLKARTGWGAAEEGATLVEYSLLAVLIVAVAVGAVTFLGVSVRSKLFEMAAGV